jgi:hypothetical protein
MSLAQLMADVREVRSEVERMRKGMLRTGAVKTVDTSAGTLSVDYGGTDRVSAPMPWFDPPTSHRPPAVGDLVLVIDPSLGRGAAVALVGWPSTANPSPLPGDDHALYVGDHAAVIQSAGVAITSSEATTIETAGLTIESSDAVVIVSSDISLGESPSDYAALSARCDEEFTRIWNLLKDPSIIPAPSAPPDVGEPGLLVLKSLASAQSALVLSVAATQVKVK